MSRTAARLLECPIAPLRTNPIVYFDITIEKDPVGRVSFELFRDAVPKTVENFRSLCTGERGRLQGAWKSGSGNVPLHYKGIPFHRIVSDFVIQGGDIVRGTGRASESIFGYRFMNESVVGKAREHLPGTLAMATSGPNQNGSQFFINIKRNEHLDGKMVVFGQVLEGGDVLVELSKVGSQCGVPRKRCWISDCGQSGVKDAREEYGVDFVEDQWYMHPPREILETTAPRV
eukprot:PhM_4_TR3304/c0_g1_i1/m.71787/K01802/E5.2.1.8; peptidylprolyl isomerase